MKWNQCQYYHPSNPLHANTRGNIPLPCVTDCLHFEANTLIKDVTLEGGSHLRYVPWIWYLDEGQKMSFKFVLEYSVFTDWTSPWKNQGLHPPAIPTSHYHFTLLGPHLTKPHFNVNFFLYNYKQKTTISNFVKAVILVYTSDILLRFSSVNTIWCNLRLCGRKEFKTSYSAGWYDGSTS